VAHRVGQVAGTGDVVGDDAEPGAAHRPLPVAASSGATTKCQHRLRSIAEYGAGPGIDDDGLHLPQIHDLHRGPLGELAVVEQQYDPADDVGHRPLGVRVGCVRGIDAGPIHRGGREHGDVHREARQSGPDQRSGERAGRRMVEPPMAIRSMSSRSVQARTTGTEWLTTVRSPGRWAASGVPVN